jgi:hypothetical protein
VGFLRPVGDRPRLSQRLDEVTLGLGEAAPGGGGDSGRPLQEASVDEGRADGAGALGTVEDGGIPGRGCVPFAEDGQAVDGGGNMATPPVSMGSPTPGRYLLSRTASAWR